MNNLHLWIVLGLAFIVICETAYLAFTEQDRWLGRSWRKSAGIDGAYQALTDFNIREAQTEAMMVRGAEVLSLLEPRYVKPSDFVVTERGRPMHFEDDHNKGAA